MKTVKDLKQLLNDLPPEFDDLVVVQASDPEGNDFNTFDEIVPGIYFHDDGEVHGEDYLVELYGEIPDGGVQAIVLWP